jgi:hypothetical protein
MKVSVDELRHGVAIVGGAGGEEAAIVAQLALDLAVTARFSATGEAMAIDEARRLLRLRIARHRAASYLVSRRIH